VLALVLVVASLAGPHASLTAPPRSLVAGQAWRATLVVRPAPAQRVAPTVLARPATGRTLVFAARRASRGRYRIRLVLPRAGTWRLAARVGRRSVPLRVVSVKPLPPPVSPLPGASAFRVCAGAAIPYPQYALAVGFGSAWVACVRQGEVQRVSLATGKVTARIPVPVAAWSITAGEGAVWAAALGGSVVYRINPGSNRVAAQIGLETTVPYLWAGGGALWVADDPGRAILRVNPATNQPGVRIPVGDGPAGFVFDGTYVWILNHRENTLDRIDPATNTVVRMASALGSANTSAAERIASFGGSLWVTGRGLDLLRVSPATGAVLGQTEIGPAGVDVRSDGTNLWVVAYERDAEVRGDPVAGAVLKIAADGSVISSVAPTKRLFANGVIAADGQLWLLDSVAGILLRLPA
jgi:virginiamycin B lyase